MFNENSKESEDFKMSHFSVYVFTKKNGKSVEDLLAPYDENLTMAPYVQYTREQAIAKVRKEQEDYKNGEIYQEYLKDPIAYEEKCCGYNNDPDRIDKHIDYLKNVFPKELEWTDEECYQSEAKWYEEHMIDKDGNLLSTYNPNSKWDWYEEGGRFSGNLVTKNGREVNEDWVSKIDWDKTYTPFAYVTPDGVWHERGKMGWWAIVTDEKDKDEWEYEYKEMIRGYLSPEKEIEVTVVDCHI